MTVLRQSDLKLWAKCPLAWKYQHIDGLPRLQGAAPTYGSILHHCVEYMETAGDLQGALDKFELYWRDPTLLDPEYVITHYHRGASWVKYAQEGPELLKNWWKVAQWDSDLVLAREYPFNVPIGDGHTLHGTIDKLVISYHAASQSYAVKVIDLKSNRKVPTYGFLEEDIQFSAYCFATTRPEFWEGLGPGLYEKYKDLPRRGEWVQLTVPKRMDAGVRTERHYNRLTMAVNNMAASIAMRIFVPTISGENCAYCDFRGACGMPEREDDD